MEPYLRDSPTPALPYAEWLREALPKSWSIPPHLRLIAEHLDAVTRGEIDRLAVFMPPRHAKTETITVRYPVYRLQQTPSLSCLVTGYNERFARRLGRKARNVARGRVEIAREKAAAEEWATTSDGVLMTRGVGSPPTGVGFGLIEIDDPIRRREDAESAVYREKVWDWYTDDLYTRLEPGGAIVLVMTLWHEDDLGARAVASEPGWWTVLKLPALAEGTDPLGRTVGQSLWPERFDEEALARIKGVMSRNEGPRSWEALYQQNPQPREGEMFRVGQIEIVEALPAGVQRRVRAWDMAATAGSGAYTCGVKMSTDGNGLFFVEDVRRGRWSTDERDAEIRLTAQLDGIGTAIRGPQDPGAAGVQAAQAFTRMLAGFSVKTVRVSGDKVLRADPFSAQVNAGNVKLLRGEWNRAFIEELRSFPHGTFKDQVDAASDAFSELVGGGWATDPGTLAWLRERFGG